MMPMGADDLGVTIETDLKRAVEGADAINVLRIQLERQKSSLFPSLDEYARVYGINEQVLSLANPDAIVMHPGPMNRGVEISQDVADGDRAVILDQVTNGVAVRMSVLYLLSGGEAAIRGSDQAEVRVMPSESAFEARTAEGE